MSISKVQGVDISSVSSIDSIQKSTISQLNDVDVPSGFSTDYSIEGNGSNQYISLGNQQSTVLNPTEAQINANGYTWTGWIYIDDLTTSFQLYSLGVSGTNNYYGIQIVVNRNAAFVFHFFGLNGSTPGAGSNNRLSKRTQNSTISTGQWVQLGVVVPANGYDDNTSWKLYINGSEYSGTYVNSGNSNVNLAYSGNSNIGVWTRAGSSLSNIFDGEINNAAIFNTALSSSNMTAIYNSGAPIDLSSNSGNYNTSSNLIFWMRFNEGTGTSYADSSTNSFTGSGVNTPTWSTNVPT
jgi:hypothetical protein